MTRPEVFSENYRSIAGAALIGLGLYILSGSLDTAAVRVGHLLGTISSNGVGILPSFSRPVSQAIESYAIVHQGCLRALLRVLISFWSLLLALVGAMFLGDAVPETRAVPTTANHFHNRHLSDIFEDKGLGCRFRSLSFDV